MVMGEPNLRFDSPTNQRLRNPSHAQSIAENAVLFSPSAAPSSSSSLPSPDEQRFRVVLGLGPGRSGTKSLSELLGSQVGVARCEHEMIVPRVYPRSPSGRIIDAATVNPSPTEDGRGGMDAANKGSWGADRRLEWDAPPLARGEPRRTEEEEAKWRVLRLLEQRRAFEGWIGDRGAGVVAPPTKKKMSGREWREHNRRRRCNVAQRPDESGGEGDRVGDTKIKSDATTPVVGAVSSVGLAYAHEYVALDPSVRIVVLLRPREEVVASFAKKSRGRNHWQAHRHRREPSGKVDGAASCLTVQRDKTWDGAFPNMSDEECHLAMATFDPTADDAASVASEEEGRPRTRPAKVWALRAYCDLYRDVALELALRYPDNLRIYDMHDALNDASAQEELLRWCGFDDPSLDTGLHLNKKN